MGCGCSKKKTVSQPKRTVNTGKQKTPASTNTVRRIIRRTRQ